MIRLVYVLIVGSLVLSLVHWLVRSVVPVFVGSLVLSFVRWIVRSFVRSVGRSFIRLSLLLVNRSLIPSFVP